MAAGSCCQSWSVGAGLCCPRPSLCRPMAQVHISETYLDSYPSNPAKHAGILSLACNNNILFVLLIFQHLIRERQSSSCSSAGTSRAMWDSCV